jgi:hypothetical protein
MFFSNGLILSGIFPPKFGSPQAIIFPFFNSAQIAFPLSARNTTFSIFQEVINTLISWGNFDPIFDEIPPPCEILENVIDVVDNGKAICALLKNGNIFAWGDPNFGGKIPEKQK